MWCTHRRNDISRLLLFNLSDSKWLSGSADGLRLQGRICRCDNIPGFAGRGLFPSKKKTRRWLRKFLWLLTQKLCNWKVMHYEKTRLEEEKKSGWQEACVVFWLLWDRSKLERRWNREEYFTPWKESQTMTTKKADLMGVMEEDAPKIRIKGWSFTVYDRAFSVCSCHNRIRSVTHKHTHTDPPKGKLDQNLHSLSVHTSLRLIHRNMFNSYLSLSVVLAVFNVLFILLVAFISVYCVFYTLYSDFESPPINKIFYNENSLEFSF